MKRTLGWTLLLVGIAVVCVGVYLALAPVIAMYADAMNDPLAGSGEDDGKAVAKKMFTGVVVGAIGLPLTITGSFLLGRSFVQRMRERQRRAR